VAPLLRLGGAVFQSIPQNIRIKNRFRVLKSLGDNVSEYLIVAGALPESFNEKLFIKAKSSADSVKEYYAQYFQGMSFLDGVMRAELRTKLVDDLLSVDDSMSMAHSLELRVPMLDNRLVDLMVPLPWQMKYSPGTYGKILLRKAVREILPEESFRKPKWGFSVNVSSWYMGEFGQLANQILPDSEAIKAYFRENVVQKVLSKAAIRGNRRFQVLAWQLLGFHFWHKIFIESDRCPLTNFDLNTFIS
jgi:asparagine synthetase B (glutamine-hydrolysing)